MTVDVERGTPDVLMLPDYTLTNPYQWELILALAQQGVSVTLTDGIGDKPLSGAIASYGRPRVVHLHWIDPFFMDGNGGEGRGEDFLRELAEIRRRGTRVVWTVHNLFGHEPRSIGRERRFRRSIAELSHATIAHCRAAKDEVATAYGLDAQSQKRIRVIPHGHYLRSYPNSVTSSEARACLGLDEDATVFLFLGQLRRYKGLLSLLDAFQSLTRADLRLLIAGRPAEQDLHDLVRARSKQDERVVTRVGHVPDEEVQNYLRAADAVVLPYLDVFTSGGAVLAMSFGRPVIAPRVGCLPETLAPHANILYDPQEPDGLAGALRRALSMDLPAAGRQNRDDAEELDWAAIADATRRCYGIPRRQPTPLSKREPRPSPWAVRAELAREDVAKLVPGEEQVAVLDEETLRNDLGQPTVPFPAQGGVYSGRPDVDWDATAELARCGQQGISFLVVMWPAFWWLDEYVSLARALRMHARCLLHNDRVAIYELEHGCSSRGSSR